MSNYSEEIWTLITRVLSGEATPAEQRDLRQWLEEDFRHKEFFRNIESSWLQDPEQSSETFFYDYESGLDKLRTKLDQQQSVSGKIIPKREKHFLLRHTWAVAAVALLAVTLSVFATLSIWNQPDIRNSYVTSDVEQRIITLPDGSVVRLNRNSRIEVGDSNGLIREVQLQGEAFFDVAKDPDRPFIIHTDEAVIQVLGTSFNVKEGDEVMVAVKEGIVSLRNRNHEEKSAARLVAGQLGLLSKGGQDVEIEDTNVENYMSWMNGYLKFESMPFGQVVRQMERIYGMEHELDDPSIDSIHLSVYTERMQKEEVLETIALALDLTYYEQEGVIHWQREKQRSE